MTVEREDGASFPARGKDDAARARHLLAILSAACVLIGVALLLIYAFVVPA